MKELESLQNAVISVNLEGLKIRQVYSEDNRKKTNRFTLDLNGVVISPVLNYDKMNHFILGFSKAKKQLEGAKQIMNSKFTPGPWLIDKPDFETINIVVDGGFICELPSNGFSVHPECKEEAIANAKLIAAAPDLLQALQSFVDYLDSDLSDAERHLKLKAIKAINKAIK